MSEGLISNLGIEIDLISKGKVLGKMPVDDRTTQPFGFLHGGASLALAETLASIGTLENVDRDTHNVFAIEINGNHVHSVREGFVHAEAILLNKTGSIYVWDIKIKDDNNRLLCISRCTCLAKIKDNKKS